MDYYDTRENNNQPKKKKEKRGGMGPSNSSVLLLFVLAAVAILALTAFSIAGKNKGKATSGTAPTPSAVPTQGGVQTADKEIYAILESIDTTAKTMQVYDIDEKISLTIGCHGGTDLRDKYGGLLVLGQFAVGDILEISYDGSTNRAAKIAVSDETWEYTRQSGLTVNPSRAILAVKTNNYAYSERLHLFQDGLLMELSDLSKQDVFTMRGMGTEIYVILVTRGHGYLSLSEAEDYLGGSLYLNQDYKAQITEELQLEVLEGSYEVYLENGDLTASLTAQIVRNQTTVLDLTEYAKVPDPMGLVSFQIQPEGAILYIDDASVYYASPVELPYGTYGVRVESGGYVTYEGTLQVLSAAMDVAVTLVENAVAEPDLSEDDTEETGETNPDETGEEEGDEEGSDTPDEDSTSEQPSNTGEEAYEMDEDHYIIIYSDDEVEVYLDGDYMGVTEDGQAVFEKFLGSFTLELVKDGDTLSYVIQVDDDGEDFVFRRFFD